MPRYFKHIIHVILLYACMIAASYFSWLSNAGSDYHSEVTPLGLFMFFLQLVPLLAIPQMVLNILGLTFYDTFPQPVKVNQLPAPEHSNGTPKSNGQNGFSYTHHQDKPVNNNSEPVQIDVPQLDNMYPVTIPPPSVNKFSNVPHLCFRIVTRGCFPDLVNDNVRTNLLTCIESGLMDFSIEVVTDIDINIPDSDSRVKQIVVPRDYETATKAKFKARALQYALEPGKSSVQDDQYIVHLDEETIITRNVIYGIVNFALDGKHAFGQGLITYANLEIVNIVTTLADSVRVARDLGNIRFTLAALHKPILGIKGSFVVTKCSAEKDVSFDHGMDGSIAEDCYFSMIALKKGYTFDFIMGEMYEKSPFTMMDLIRQRERWLQGIWLVVKSSKIPWGTKFWLATALYAWISLPLASLCIFGMISEVPYTYYLKPINALTMSSTVYMYLFGLVKSFDLKQSSFGILVLYFFLQILMVAVCFVVENLVVIYGVFTNKHHFYIVEKESKPKLQDGQKAAPVVARF